MGESRAAHLASSIVSEGLCCAVRGQRDNLWQVKLGKAFSPLASSKKGLGTSSSVMSGRLEVWGSSLRLFQNITPLINRGVGSFTEIVPEYHTTNKQTP